MKVSVFNDSEIKPASRERDLYIMNDEPDTLNVYLKIPDSPPFGTDLIFLRNEYRRPAHLK